MAKVTLAKVQRHPNNCETSFAHVTSDKGLISKFYKSLIKININKSNNHIKK